MFATPGSIKAQTAALLLLLSLFVPSISHASRNEVTTSRQAALAGVDIENFGCINPNYYRGGAPQAGDYANLAALGIKTLIDLRGDDGDNREKAFVENAGMNYVRIPMATHEKPSAAQTEQFLRIVNDPSKQPVYVHCVAGRHRTGVMTALYRMAIDGWTADQAFDEMKKYHFGPAFLHSAFKKFVYEYEAAHSAAAATK